ncbi:unnamed protein product [Danaus chrysippus]|uniref:(African queen) hypothetical protein n=1 Tax=Danaus chrysippus TaxID=151541 RepID=A0A8J2QS01_9NEOP|nr:unnamed protein product [Danaus chrysippus]
MKKAANDPKVKKSLLRNYEKRISKESKAVLDVDSDSSNVLKANGSQKENKLDQPTLCTSEVLASYLVGAHSAIPPLTTNDTNINKTAINAKVTKKLNFHFNDRIYKNLVEINTDVANLKCKKDMKTKSTTSLKKDLEPSIDDFCSNEKEDDEFPDVPDIKPKFKAIRKMEDGRLHQLIASFEKL